MLRPAPTESGVRAPGFTLIELMVTVAIVAILAAVALPSYNSYVLRSHRSDGLSTLTQDQAILERCYAQSYSYAAATCTALTLPQTSPQGYYYITGALAASTYTLTATAQGSQQADTACLTMTLDQTNTKSPTACWNP